MKRKYIISRYALYLAGLGGHFKKRPVINCDALILDSRQYKRYIRASKFEGHINGVPFYYRARHGNHEIVLRPFTELESIVFSGESKNAGWWSAK